MRKLLWMGVSVKTGKVAWYNQEKGIGFIEDDEKNLVLVDVSSITSKNKELLKGQLVRFDFEQDPSGELIATTVKPQKDLGV